MVPALWSANRVPGLGDPTLWIQDSATDSVYEDSLYVPDYVLESLTFIIDFFCVWFEVQYSPSQSRRASSTTRLNMAGDITRTDRAVRPSPPPLHMSEIVADLIAAYVLPNDDVSDTQSESVRSDLMR